MILIALGANLPSRRRSAGGDLSSALGRLKECGITILAVSSFYQTPAWPDASEPPYINAVASIATRLQPAELLLLLHDVEAGFGRDAASGQCIPQPGPGSAGLWRADHRFGACAASPRMAERSFRPGAFGRGSPRLAAPPDTGGGGGTSGGPAGPGRS
jgi:2-amino-4-hydroxy-6-hydroxymethyldihydropteridine diphosphokinase